MKKIVLAYHGYMFGDKYMPMMCEQFRKLIRSGLYNAASKFYIGIVDSPDKKPDNGLAWINTFWNASSSKGINPLPGKIEIVVYPDNHMDTLKWIRDYAKENPDEYVMYFQNGNTEIKRKDIEHIIIENWRDCIAKLDECDIYLGYIPNFSCGMWWVNTSYINSLIH